MKKFNEFAAVFVGLAAAAAIGLAAAVAGLKIVLVSGVGLVVGFFLALAVIGKID